MIAASPLGRTGAGAIGRRRLFRAGPIALVWIGFVGLGRQGGRRLPDFLKIPGCRITPACEVRAQRTLGSEGDHRPRSPRTGRYAQGPRGLEPLSEIEALDSVFHVTPWEFHVPIMLAA